MRRGRFARAQDVPYGVSQIKKGCLTIADSLFCNSFGGSKSFLPSHYSLVFSILRRKHSTVFSIRQQMVMGPTPPGTGVMADALGSTAAKSTSPHNFLVSGSLLAPRSNPLCGCALW